METQEQIFAFFRTLPGIVVLAAAAAAVGLLVLLRRIRSRAGAVEELPAQGQGAPAAQAGTPPRWLVAAVSAYLAVEEAQLWRPSAAAWKPAAGRYDPWVYR